ncbi:MAG: hypothetical protein ACYTFG_04755, partial [Planctomycetota bacterium]
VRSGHITLDFRLPEVLSSEDLPFEFTATAEVAVDTSDAEAVKDFGGFFLTDATEATFVTVRDALMHDVEEAARNYAASHEAAYLARGERSAEIEEKLRAGLKRILFEAGLTLHELTRVTFESEEYARILDGKIVATVEDEKTKRRDIIRQAWLKDQKDEILSKREVQDFVRALEHEGALKELERRKEKLAAEKELQVLAQKSAEEKIANTSRTASNVVKMLEEAGFENVLDNFLHIAREEVQTKTGAKGTGIDARLHGVKEGRTKRVLCVAGRNVLAYRPDRATPEEVHSTEDGSLGMLRSVRVLNLGEKEVIAAGAQYGVYIIDEGERTRESRIPTAGDKRGGVNAIAVYKDELFATHSDYGLVRWKIMDEAEGGPIRADLTGGAQTCRGVKNGPLDRLLFAAGPKIVSLVPESVEGTPTVFQGCGDAVTTFAVTAMSIFAGTAGGEVVRWELASPDAPPRRAAAKRPDPIFMLKLFSVAGIPHLVVGSKSYSLLTTALEMDTEVSYPSEVRIRWVDGASDHLYGIDRDGRRLLVWETGNPRSKPMEVRSQERIQDLCVWPEGG